MILVFLTWFLIDGDETTTRHFWVWKTNLREVLMKVADKL